MIAFVIVISCLSLGFAVFLARQVIAKDTGTPKMREISDAIKEGAEAFMSRQNRTIISLSAVLALLIFVLYGFVRAPSKADPVPPVELAFWTTLAFVLGAACSVVAGYVGMWVSIRANIFRRRGLEQVRAAAGAVADIVADEIGDNRRVARIVLWDARFNLAHQVRAHVRRFGIDTTAELGEKRDEGCAKAVADDGEWNFLRIMAERLQQRI